jgi:CO/xanthine dehydrogenase Mo-binding subunit
MSTEPFKLTEEMTKEIEEKVNNLVNEVPAMKERLVKAGCYTPFSSVTVCEVSIDIETGKVTVHDPISYSDEEDEEEDEDW